MIALRVGKATDVGLIRHQNQDQLLVAAPLFAVADGMGGHAAGEVASLTAIEALRAAFERGGTTAGSLQDGVRQANRAVWDRTIDDQALAGMGTTMTAIALVEEDGQEIFAVANVGDSRTYLLRDGELQQLTEDHSLVQDMVRAGQLSAADAAVHPQRNILTRVLGQGPEVEVDALQVVPVRGDRYLLASDGLFGEVTDDTIASVLRRLADPDDAVRELIRLARAHGGGDNITAVLVDVMDDGGRSEEASAVLGAGGGLLSHADRNAELRKLVSDEPDSNATTAVRPAVEPDPAFERPLPVTEPSRITARVVGFLVVLLLLAGVALGVTAWYARASYYVGLDGEQVAIWKGRPGGLLWFKPTLVEHTRLTTQDVAPRRVDELQEGRVESSLLAARRFAGRLSEEANALDLDTTTTTDTTDTTRSTLDSPGETSTTGVSPATARP